MPRSPKVKFPTLPTGEQGNPYWQWLRKVMAQTTPTGRPPIATPIPNFPQLPAPPKIPFYKQPLKTGINVKGLAGQAGERLGGAFVSMADIQADAQETGRSVDDVIREAEASGYRVIR